MIIWGIDPGPKESAVVIVGAGPPLHICRKWSEENSTLETSIANSGYVRGYVNIAIESMTPQGRKGIAQVTIDTIRWIGRFEAACNRGCVQWKSIPRNTVRTRLAGPQGNDASVRRTLIDLWGGKARAIGTKAAPGPLYGITGHQWAALAVAVVYARELGVQVGMATVEVTR